MQEIRHHPQRGSGQRPASSSADPLPAPPRRHGLLLIPVILYLLRTLWAHLFTWRYLARSAERSPRPGGAAPAPSLSIIVPVRGVDERAALNFRSYLQQRYPAPCEVLFCVEELSDPAVPIIEEALRASGGAEGRLIESPTSIRAAGKLKNLIAGVGQSRHDLLAFVDSDVYLPPDFLHEAAAATADPGVGLSFASPVGQGTAGPVAALHNLGVNASVLHLGERAYFDRLEGAIGSLMLMRRDVLQAIGGLEQFGERIVGIDITIARAVVAAGYRIRLLRRPAPIFHAHDTLPRWWRQTHRWLVTIRCYYPALVPAALLFGFPLWWSLLYALSGRFHSRATAVRRLGSVAAVAGVQLLSAAVVNARFARDHGLWRYLWVVPLQDILGLPALLSSAVTNTVVWRGQRIRLDKDCSARRVEERPPRPGG